MAAGGAQALYDWNGIRIGEAAGRHRQLIPSPIEPCADAGVAESASAVTPSAAATAALRRAGMGDSSERSSGRA